MDNNLRIIYTPVPSVEVAKALSLKIVEQKLALCCNIIPNIFSIYEWKDEIHQNEETLLLVKTTLLEQAQAFLQKNHPYEDPVIILL